MSDPFDALLLESDDPECSRVRALMLDEAERGLSSQESATIETHVGACRACQSLLDGSDERLALPSAWTAPAPWSPPIDAEWLRTASPHRDARASRPARSSTTPWRVLVPLAAAILGAILLAQLSDERFDEGAEGRNPASSTSVAANDAASAKMVDDPADDGSIATSGAGGGETEFVDLIGLPEEASVQIVYPEEDDGAVIVLVNEY